MIKKCVVCGKKFNSKNGIITGTTSRKSTS